MAQAERPHAVGGNGREAERVETPTDISQTGVTEITRALNALVADSFALYLKTKNFHWHVSGPHFHSYHLMFDEHAEQIFASIDEVAERVRKIGGRTLHSIGEVDQLRRVKDNDQPYVRPFDMLTELMLDNKAMLHVMREVHGLCERHGDIATAGVLETLIDQTERRNWFLFEVSRDADGSGR